jgi:hypothetical protein
MTRPYLAVAVLFLLPVVVFFGGAQLMSAASRRQAVNGQTPLNTRWRGYDTETVASYWGALDETGRRAEGRFLEFDLVFPTLYGGALAASLATASAMLGGPVHVAWLIAPVVVAMAADWVENLVQLEQLRKFVQSGKKGLAAGGIRLASAATMVKLLFSVIASLALLGLLVALLLSPRSSR